MHIFYSDTLHPSLPKEIEKLSLELEWKQAALGTAAGEGNPGQRGVPETDRTAGRTSSTNCTSPGTA